MNLELLPAGSPRQRTDLEQAEWGPPGTPLDVVSSVDPWLTQFGPVSAASIDLVRIAAAAYLADRLSARRTGYSRTIEAHVQVTEPDRWSPQREKVEGLLHWLSSDEWRMSFGQDETARPSPMFDEDDTTYEAVALLSGGLDSFCGAVLNPGPTLYVSHTDNPVVSASQNRCWTWLDEADLIDGASFQVHLCERGSKRERSTRTRALLFYALALAAADAHGIGRVEVPENGFTSINFALGNERGGVLSTRSTHPWTLHLLHSLLEDVDAEVAIANPYEMMTKGELIAAAASGLANFTEGAAETLSCAKLDGRFLGGNTHHNCGLCIACLTRRGGMLAAGVDDSTPYLLATLPNERVLQLRDRREDDVLAVRRAVALAPAVDEFDLVAQAQFPDTYDLTMCADLVRRGFAELSLALGES